MKHPTDPHQRAAYGRLKLVQILRSIGVGSEHVIAGIVDTAVLSKAFDDYVHGKTNNPTGALVGIKKRPDEYVGAYD
jgi:hypothetical protein